MTKGQLLEVVAEYFANKGKFMTMREYKQQADFPISPNMIIRCFGSWGRLPGKIRKYHSDLAAKIDNIDAVAREAVEEPVKPRARTASKPVEE